MSLMENLNSELERSHDQYRAAITRTAQIVCYQLAIIARDKYPTSKVIVLGESDQDYVGGRTMDGVLDADGDELDEDDEYGDTFADVPVSDLYDSNESVWMAFAVQVGAPPSQVCLDIDLILTAMEAE